MLECAQGCDAAPLLDAVPDLAPLVVGNKFDNGADRQVSPTMPAPALTFVSAAELRASTPDEPGWVFDGYVARGAVTSSRAGPRAARAPSHAR